LGEASATTLARIRHPGELVGAGYAVDAIANGEDALLTTLMVPYDVAILDVNLPGPAVLFLAAREGIDDRVAGPDLGTAPGVAWWN
jgi:hypothetical protein